MNHLNQEPLDFAAARNLLRQARTDLMLALALLRELNDALVIPGWLQPRVDAVLDGSESGKPFASIPCEYTGGSCTRGWCKRERLCQAMENRHQPQEGKPTDGH